MITILPMPQDVLLQLSDTMGLTADGMVWGYVAAKGLEMVGFCLVAEPDSEGMPCRILAVDASDKYIADGLLRKGLHMFYDQGIGEYTFDAPPNISMLPDYMIIGTGSLAKLFRPCPAN